MRMMIQRAFFFSLALLLLGLAPSQAAEPPLKVTASFTVLADIVSQIGGDRVAVSALVGPGADAHSFQPSPRDAQTVLGADLVVLNGLGFEGWSNRLIKASGYKGPIIEAAAGIKPREMPKHAHGHAHGHDHAHGKSSKQGPVQDPHVWNSMPHAQSLARTIGAALSAARPAEAAYFAQRTEDYVARLAALDAFARAEIAKLPPNRRKAITSHDAFGYLAAEYGLTFLSPVGVSTESEPSAAGVARLIRQIKAEKIPAIFVENISDPRLAQQIARDSGAKIGGLLYSDSLSAADGPASSLERMFRRNIETLVAALKP
jgi:zinc/manganese transport system substrate-binding protein